MCVDFRNAGAARTKIAFRLPLTGLTHSAIPSACGPSVGRSIQRHNHTSNLSVARDWNLRLTLQHTRVVYLRIRRLPSLGRRTPPPSGKRGTPHWLRLGGPQGTSQQAARIRCVRINHLDEFRSCVRSAASDSATVEIRRFPSDRPNRRLALRCAARRLRPDR